ncbi:hypothetical protein V7S43_003829 [Phytophthora oleae]|uniref:Uncharacterized protein n=1 Tax=Phytophthora oleae TaxID=2107226 RepID=A0ABD3FUM8_9STRA
MGHPIGNEEFMALEATLAFFDDGRGDESFSSDHSSDDSASVSESGGRNRSRDLQKLELLQLRVEAAALQENLTKLRHSSLDRRHDTIALDVWRCLAKKQKRLRGDAERLNEELRVVYAKQIETMKALKRIFRKQAEEKRSACILRNFFVNAYFDVEKDAVLVIKQLSSTLGKVFADTDCVFRLNGLDAITSPFSKTNTHPLSATSTHIEVLKCGVLPFDFRAVADAFYGKLTAGCGLIKVENVNTSNAQVQDVIARAFTVEVEERVKIQYRDAAFRYSEHNREVIVLAGQNLLMEAFGVALDGMSFTKQLGVS